jgi:hypothetical protein
MQGKWCNACLKIGAELQSTYEMRLATCFLQFSGKGQATPQVPDAYVRTGIDAEGNSVSLHVKFAGRAPLLALNAISTRLIS